MPSQIMQMMMNQLKARNPQVFQKYEQLKNSNGDPVKMLKEVTGGFTPEQMQGFTNLAKRFGFSEEQIKGINTK